MFDLRLLIDPTKDAVDKVRLKLTKQIRDHPDKKFLVIYVFACHGI